MQSTAPLCHLINTILFYLSVLAIVNRACAQGEDEDYVKLQSEMELIQWDLQDECSIMARNAKAFHMHEITGLRDKIRGEVDHANFLRIHANRLEMYNDIPYDMHRNWTRFTKCGDALLSTDEFQAFTVFANKNLDFKSTHRIGMVDASGVKSLLGEEEVREALATSRNATQLEEIWMKWETGTKPLKNWYYEALQMVNKATLANDCTNVATYWEMLSEFQNGYEISQTLFDAIQPLYNKLHKFVRLRINQYYNTTFDDYFPTYLTGSFSGEDWSNIADILLPNPQLYYDMKVEIGARDIEDLYNHAANMTKNLGFGDVVNPAFFKRSNLHHDSCATKVLVYCAEHYSSILTCNRTTVGSYFDTYETAMQLGLTSINFHSKIMQDMRFSPVLEGMQSMASLMSVNSMLQNKIVAETVFLDSIKREENRMTIMLLLALRILPKIAYYHAMDTFRLDLLVNQGSVGEVYRKHVEAIQGLSAVKEITSEYLRDEYILFNRPYLSKMLGLFLQFQVLNYFQIDLFEEADISTLFNKDTTFRDFVRSIPNRDAPELLSYYFNIDEISDYPLLNFFAPLNEYLNVAPMEQAAFKLKTPTFVRSSTTTTATTTTASTTTRRLKKSKATPALQLRAAGSATHDGAIQVKTNTTTYRQTTTQSAPHLGIYIGAAIVVMTLALIAAGFVKQRRKQRNHRRYNA